MSFQIIAKTSSETQLFEGYPSFQRIQCDSGLSGSTGEGSETVDSSELSSTDSGSGSGSSLSSPNNFITSKLSPCGRFLAISTEGVVKVLSGKTFENALVELPLKEVYDLEFSPSGSFLSTWERPHIDHENHQNVKIWFLNEDVPSNDTPRYQYQAKTQNAWALQFSKLDNFAIRKFGKELRISKLSHSDPQFDFNKPYAKLVSEVQVFTYLISPAEYPTICTFSPEKGGKPAQLTIYPIIEGTITKKIASKTFFKADSCQLKWNSLGNAILCLANTDFDASNQSYYGENTLYLLSFQGVNGALGGESVRVPLSKEGPIHDFTWSPTSRQFCVIYGFMPATITFFDLKGNAVHTLTEQRKNTILFSQSGRYILIAGFGNLQGSVDILDRHDKFKSIAKFDAANTSTCKWSPGGEFILTATTSPRLRVDNGFKIWHVTGKLCFVNEYNTLLEAAWRSPCPFKTKTPDSHVITNWDTTKIKDFSAIKDPVLTANQLDIHPSVTAYSIKNPKTKNGNNTSAKSVGAYKPPHARRAGATNGSSSPSIPGSTPKATKSIIPGLPVKESKSSNKNHKRRENAKKNEKSEKNDESSTPASNSNDGDTEQKAQPKPNKETSPEEKKIRSLLKKLRAIETLKQRQANGDKLEDTQILKIQSEQKVLEELNYLGWSP